MHWPFVWLQQPASASPQIWWPFLAWHFVWPSGTFAPQPAHVRSANRLSYLQQRGTRNFIPPPLHHLSAFLFTE